jgi:transcriptional regulator with GAF, ATPase, and Fis domain
LTDRAELEALFRSESVGIGIFDHELRYRRVNERLASIDEFPLEDHPGRTLEEVLGARAPLVRPELERALRGERVFGKVLDGGSRQMSIDAVRVGADALAVLVTETTERRDAESALAARLRLAELISELSAAFIELPALRVDDGIREALATLATGLDIARASLWKYDVTRLSLSETHEWIAEGEPAGVPGRSVTLQENGYFGRQLLDGEDVVVPAVSALPPDAAWLRTALEQLGVKSFLGVPMLLGGQVKGLLAVSRSRHERAWSEETVATLHLASQIIVNALERKHQDRELRCRLEFEQGYGRLSAALNTVSTTDVAERVRQALEHIGKLLDFVESALWMFSPEHPESYAWHAAGVTPRAVSWVELLDENEWPMPALLAGEVVIASSAELPNAKYRQSFAGNDSRRLHVAVPVRIAGRTAGAVLLQARTEPESGRIELAHRVRLLVDLVAATLGRIQADVKRQRTLDELEQLKSSLEAERDFLRQEVKGEPGQRELLGQSPALCRALDAVEAVAATNATVLLLGESGVGKELFARAVHERSQRADAPLVKVNCAAIPEELFESEFFGHVRGAFTGALKDRVGRFELAHHGTLFLDEIGEIPRSMQSKLLRVLQEGELERVGDDRTRRVDVRIVAATNRNLVRDVAAGSFRQDLYYRLSVFPIHIPPLRERRDDIPLLARHFLAQSRRALGRPELDFSAEQLRALVAYDWPGNVRELQHVIERAAILARTTRHLVLDLDTRARSLEPGAPPLLTEGELQELSRRSVLTALERSNWRISGSGGAAELLGLKPSTLRDRMQLFNIKRPS